MSAGARCGSDPKPALQAEGPRQANRPLPQKGQGCVGVCICAVPWGGRLPRTVSQIAAVLWDPGAQAIRVRQSRDVPQAAAAKMRSSCKNEVTQSKNQVPHVTTRVLVGWKSPLSRRYWCSGDWPGRSVKTVHTPRSAARIIFNPYICV